MQLLTAMSLRCISNKFCQKQDRTTHIAFDGMAVISSSYSDILVRFYNRANICSYHVWGINIFEDHTSNHMFWCSERVPTILMQEGRKFKWSGFASKCALERIEKLSENSTRRFWRVLYSCSGGHQPDLVIHAALRNREKNHFKIPFLF